MLKEEIVDAVKKDLFHIYSVEHIDQGIEVLTGKKAGEKNKEGLIDEGSINYLVNKKLKVMAEKLFYYSKNKDN